MNRFAVVGLGYVGLGIAIALSKKGPVWGYDVNQQRIETLRQCIDRNNLFSSAELTSANKNLMYTHQVADIQSANFYIVSVATPAYCYETPDLEPLIGATKDVAGILKKGDIVVFESTVYQGVTDEVCIPILEKVSQLKNGEDFHVGYSPERINPGDSAHTLKTITKIVSAQDPDTLKIIQAAYETICDKVYPVSNIRTAESIKLLENTQRDVNIALMNEFSKIMHELDVDMHEVIEGAKTKWGFVPYKPGIVGGHCISIDPHYLAFKAKRHGIQPELILAARRVNDGMSQFVINAMIKLLIKNHLSTTNLRIGLFGITYKENVRDLRNSLALKVYKELGTYGFECFLHDPLVDQKENYPFKLTALEDLSDLYVAIILVGHDFYRDLGLKKILEKCKKNVVVLDVPNLFVDTYQKISELVYWNL